MTVKEALSIMMIQRPSRGTAEKLEAYDMAIEALKALEEQRGERNDSQRSNHMVIPTISRD